MTDTRKSSPEKIAQFLLTFDGMAFLPLVTAAIVGARLTGSLQTRDRPISDHVIVAGLGNVGTRILGQLHDLGVGVVCVDKSENAAGVPLARRLGLKVVIGETHREETLLAAGIASCQALVSVTDSDIVNLETALHARALAERPRIVVRLYDDDLAERVQKAVGNTISRSVSYLAAPAFAAAMLEHQVLRTIPVGRHVLLIAEVTVGAGSRAGRRAGRRRARRQRRAADRPPAPGRDRGRLVTAARRRAQARRRAGRPGHQGGPVPGARAVPFAVAGRPGGRPAAAAKLGLPKARFQRYAQGRSSTWFC